MLDAAGPVARRELEARLAADLTDEPTAADRRAAELGALASMLNMRAPARGWTYSTIGQAEYEKRRPDDAPPASVLAERYDGWKRACKAAYGLKPDGRTLGRSHHAWPHPGRGRPWIEPYTVDEVVRAIRRCGLELACRPSSTTYVRWSATKRRLARENNKDVRIPNINAVYRHFGPRWSGARDAWRRAAAAAAITDDDLREAHVRRMKLDQLELTAADELDPETAKTLQAAGVTDESIELIQQGEPGKLKLWQAVVAARTVGCSLAFLIHATRERGQPPAGDLRFDHVAYLRRRRDAGIAAERVRQVLGLGPRDGRRLALGTYEPTVGQVTTLEQMLSLPPGAFLSR
jgi:hypothetical protein